MCDPAILANFTADATQKYRLTRNIEDLDLKSTSEPITVFRCKPLLTKWKHLIDSVRDNASSAMWSIFRHHVLSAKNFDDDKGQPIIELVDDAIPDKKQDDIPIDVISEIALVIVEKAMETSKGFSQPGDYLAALMRVSAVQVLADDAPGDTATNPTESSD